VDVETQPLLSFSAEMARLGMKPSSRVLESKIVGASTIMARALGVEVGAQLAYLRRLRLADGDPMAIQESYLPHELCPGLLSHDLEGSLFAVLMDVYGLALATCTRTFEATLGREEEASLLGLSLPAAVLVVEQIGFLGSGRVIEFSKTTYRGDRYRRRERFGCDG
jgi:GntR family transcriptional regulator